MDDLVPITGPDAAAGLSFAGVEYTPGADGVLWVPADAVAVAIAHGFTALDPSTTPRQDRR